MDFQTLAGFPRLQDPKKGFVDGIALLTRSSGSIASIVGALIMCDSSSSGLWNPPNACTRYRYQCKDHNIRQCNNNCSARRGLTALVFSLLLNNRSSLHLCRMAKGIIIIWKIIWFVNWISNLSVYNSQALSDKTTTFDCEVFCFDSSDIVLPWTESENCWTDDDDDDCERDFRKTGQTCYKEEERLSDGEEKVFDCAFHPSQPVLACGLSSGSIRLFRGHDEDTPFARWTPDDRFRVDASSHIHCLAWNVIKL